MSDHIGSFLNLKRRITEAGYKLENILVIHAILHSLPRSNIWDVVKQNLLDKGKGLTLDVLTAELISVHDYSEHDHLADEKDKKAKSNQIALFTKPSSSSNDSRKREKKAKHLDKGKKPRTQPAGTKCHVCGQEGHWAPECTFKVNRDLSQPEVSANLAIEQLQSSEVRKVGKMLMASTDTISSTDILLYCSATSHIFTSREHFVTYVKSSNEFVTVSGYNKVPIADRGSVLFSAMLPSGWLSITLQDVLHIPYLGTNLVSLGALHCKGAFVQSFDKGLAIFKDGEELFRASLTGFTETLYHIQCTSPVTGTAYLAGSLLSMRLWHWCMGHLSPQAIDSTQHQNLVKGLKISISHEFDHIYSDCANGKSHRFPFPNSSSTHYTKIELVVMDITGPMSVPTWDGFLYALVIVEVSCRYSVERLLHTKEDVGVTVCDVLAMLERQSGLKVCCLCSDNGSEFVNNIINTFCHCNGIIHETTISYTPEQNGIAEWAIAVFFEMVRSMLYTVNVSLWY